MESEPPCIQAILSYEQADEEGIMVLVSRQAIHETVALARRGAADTSKGFTAGWVTGRAAAAKVANEMFWAHTNGKFDSFNGDPTWTAGDHGAYIASTIEAAIRTLPPPPSGEPSDE